MRGSVFVPGRINLIGEHLDYNGGMVLPFTVNKGLLGKWQARDDAIIHIHSLGREDYYRVPCGREWETPPQEPWYKPAWAMLCKLRELFPRHLCGFIIEIQSSLPSGAGLSSSAAVEILISQVFCQVNMISMPSEEVCRAVQEAEHRFLNVRCGIMDMWSIVFGRKGFLTAIDCSTFTHTYVPLDISPYRIVVIHSGLPRTLAKSFYNERRLSCERALHDINQYQATSFLAQAEMGSLNWVRDEADRKRARHVLREQLNVRESIEALLNKDLHALGALLKRSHQSLATDFEVSTPELDFLVSTACAHHACLGARLTGAGFGGCVIALVHQKHVYEFTREIMASYRKEFALCADIFEIDSGSMRTYE